MAADFETFSQGVELPPLRQPFTAAAATEINANYRLRVAGVVHGSVEGPAEFLPQPEDYKAAAEEVTQLDAGKGDVLFMEGWGHGGNQHPVLSMLEIVPPAGRLRAVKTLRRKRLVHTLAYAMGLAWARNVPVLPADVSGGQLQAISRATGEAADRLVWSGSQYARYVNLVRETEAAYAVGKHALATLPQTLARSVRPTYLTLFGVGHFDQQDGTGIPEAFSRMGLRVERRVLYDPEHLSARRRYVEQRIAERTLRQSASES